MKDAGIAIAGRRSFRADQVPAAHQGAHRGGSARGTKIATEDTYHSMAVSRGASALGVALALGEIEERARSRRSARTGRSIPSVASTSAGVELLRNEIVVLGNSAEWAGDLVIGHE